MVKNPFIVMLLILMFGCVTFNWFSRFSFRDISAKANYQLVNVDH